MILACSRANAQAFGLSVVPSANSILVSNSLIYTINVTNLTGITLTDVWITNSFSAPFHYVTYSPSQPIVGVLPTATNVLFDLGSFNIGGSIQVLLTVQPNAVGAFTNSVVTAVPGQIYATSTNAVIQVNALVTPADLGVTMIGPLQAVITN